MKVEIDFYKNTADHYTASVSFIADGKVRAAVSVMGKTPLESISKALTIVLRMAPNGTQEELDGYWHRGTMSKQCEKTKCPG